MTRPAPDRRFAISQARLAQGACVVLVLAGGAMGVLGLPGDKPAPAPEKIEIPRVASDIKTAEPAPVLRPVDFRGVSTRMGQVGNAPKVPEIEKTGGGEIPPAPPPAPSEARYIGTMIMGPKLLAIIVDGPKQRVMKVGDTFADGGKIVLITQTEIVIEGPGGRRTIQLAERTGEGISRATPAAPTPANARGNIPTARPADKLNPKSAAAMNRINMSPPVKNPSRRTGTPDGSPERFEEIIQQMRASGEYKDENSLMEAAKLQFENESMKSDGAKGGRH